MSLAGRLLKEGLLISYHSLLEAMEKGRKEVMRKKGFGSRNSIWLAARVRFLLWFVDRSNPNYWTGIEAYRYHLEQLNNLKLLSQFVFPTEIFPASARVNRLPPGPRAARRV